MSFWIGVLIFAVGILVSVCLHEAGHLLTAKRFGMKATQYFAGFGPTAVLVPARRDGVRPQGDPGRRLREDRRDDPARGGRCPRTATAPFWRVPALAAHRRAGRRVGHPLRARPRSSSTSAAITTGLPNPAAQSFDALTAKPVIGQVSHVRRSGLRPDRGQAAARLPRRRPGRHRPGRPACGTATGSLSVGGKPIATYGDLVETVRASPPGRSRSSTARDGDRRTTTADLVATQRPALGRARQGHAADGVGDRASRSRQPR